MRPTLLFVLIAALLRVEVRAEDAMSFLDNGKIRLGIDLGLGGAVTFLACDGGENVVNNFDHGRQVQMSFYSGPVPFAAGDKQPAGHWKHLGWNPIQAGDDFGHGSRVLEHRNDGHSIHVKCVPMQWPLDGVPGDCTFESWLELDGICVKARARLNNARSDKTQYPARLQELPAVYANAPFHRVVSYLGDRPFTGEAISDVPKPTGNHPWSHWQGTEQWSALLDDRGFGLGLVTPGRVSFTGGFAGKPGPNDTHATHTGYIAGQGLEILDHDIVYEYRYELVLGSLKEIRERAAMHRPATPPPPWVFAGDRQGWHFANAEDAGWPLKGALDVKLEKDDPQFIGPCTFWRAEDAPFAIIEAAFHTKQTRGTIFWQRHGRVGPDDSTGFDIAADGEFHRYSVRLADAPNYTGGIVRLRFDPVGAGSPGEWVKVRAIRLSRSP